MAALAFDFETLLEKIPRGAWVAISADHQSVVAFGSDLADVISEAKSKGEPSPIVTKVPQTQHALAY